MSAPDNSEKYILYLEADAASAQGAISQINAVQASLAGVGTTALTVAEQLAAAGVDASQVFTQAGESIGAALVPPLDAADAGIQNVIRDLGTLKSEIASMPDPSGSAFGLPDDFGAGGGGGISLSGARSGLRAGGFLLGADAGGGALRAVGQIATLTAVMGPLGIAAGLGAVALREVSENEQKATEAAKAYSTALAGVASETSSDIKKQIANLTQQKTAYEAAQVALRGIEDQAKALAANASKFPGQDGYVTEDQYIAGVNALDEATRKATGGMVTSALDISTALENGQQQIDKTTGQIGFLNVALGTEQTAANTAAAALKKLSDEQVAAAQKDIDLNNMTSAQRKEKADADLRDAAVLDSLIRNTDLTADASEQLSIQEEALLHEAERLNGTFLTTADILGAVAAATQSISDQTDAYFAALQTEISIRNDITKQLADEQQIRDDAAAAAIKAQEAFYAADDAATEEANKKALQEAQDNADRVARIERDFARSAADATGQRDAYAYQKAELKRQDDLDDQAKAYQKQQDQLTEALDAQYHAHWLAYQKQLENIQENEAKQIKVKEDAIRQDQVDLQDAIAAEQAIAQSGSGGLRVIINDAWAGILADSVNWANEISTAVHNALVIAQIGAEIGHAVNLLPPVIETPGSTTPFPSPVPVLAGSVGTRHITIQVSPTDGSEATNNFLRALDKMLPDNLREGV